MYVKMNETVVIPTALPDLYAVVRHCQEGVVFYSAEHPASSEVIYTPDKTATGAKPVGMGYAPEEHTGWPHDVILVLQADLDLDLHHWFSVNFRSLLEEA